MAKTDDDWETVPVRRGKKRASTSDEVIDLVSSPEKSISSRQPFVLILVGLPGSGKSHFASRLESADSRFGKCISDELRYL